jgi:F420-dependent oxidoreductase-like protein
MQGIRIGLSIADTGGTSLDELIAQYKQAESMGFHSAWVANIFGFDALTLCAIGARETSTLELGTAVVPTYSRHPVYMAQQALSTQAAAGGRFVLGLGPSHKLVIEDILGLSYAKPARHVREYVSVVKQLIEDRKCAFDGETYRVRASIDVVADPCPVLIGALGPIMRRICATLTDGTMTWMTGPKTLGESLIPDLQRITKEVGRPAPRVVAGFPVVLTDDPEGARAAASQMFAIYGQLPSYRAMLDAEGLAAPGDIAIAGDEKTIESAIARLASAGVTDFNAAVFAFGPDPKASVARTWELLSSLAKS